MMTDSHKKIHIQINAEVIKRFHDTRNEGKFINDFPYEQALKNATSELWEDMQRNELRITLDELLTLTLDECICVKQCRIKQRHQQLIKQLQ